MYPVNYSVSFYPRGKKTKQLLELTMANHDPQARYKQVTGQSTRWWLAEEAFLGVNTIPSVLSLGIQHLLAMRVENS